MAQGGNKPWKDFFDAHASNSAIGRTFDECTIQERYDSEAGEEWKERLTAKVEGKEYVPGTKSSGLASRAKPDIGGAGSMQGSRSATPLGRAVSGGPTSRSATPSNGGATSQKEQNEAYFARMGSANASRPDDLPPSQGGKYGGFGSDPTPSRSNNGGSIPGVDDFQKDPVAALTKGFGWLSSTVTKQAKTGYDGWVKPNMQKVRFPPSHRNTIQPAISTHVILSLTSDPPARRSGFSNPSPPRRHSSRHNPAIHHPQCGR